MTEVKIYRNDGVQLPFYATSGSSGMDVRANIKSAILLEPFIPTMIPLGIDIELPSNLEAQIRPRSSFGLKGVTIPNSPATIYSDYRGESP